MTVKHTILDSMPYLRLLFRKNPCIQKCYSLCCQSKGPELSSRNFNETIKN